MLLGPIVALFGHIPFIIASSLPNKYTTTASFDDNHGNRLVGIVSNRQSASDYDDDIKRAQYIGIDAFALNIGTDSYTDE
ncbi:Glycoside hydrolase family 71 [Penicillium solitum]|uniref:Glycoside hydrolase family 71 n=1 Tax=Penicillium solitum TaxID=60172 RepID=UPI0032C404D4|nr:Glycoside hydrolase family 71 [Penicillium solitum]